VYSDNREILLLHDSRLCHITTRNVTALLQVGGGSFPSLGRIAEYGGCSKKKTLEDTATANSRWTRDPIKRNETNDQFVSPVFFGK